MCGIVGFVSGKERDAGELLYGGLQKLEYRGYDSAGIAYMKDENGIIVKKGKIPLPIHDLAKLAAVAGVSLSAQQRDYLDEITTYNIDARYDDYKRNFYKKVTKKEYHEKWKKICTEIFLWLWSMY